MLKVLVVGQTPPPFNGQAIMIDRLLKSDPAGIELIHVRMGFSAHMNELGRVRVGKIVHLLGLIARIIYTRFASGADVLYYPPAGPDRVPMWRDVAILISTRWLFSRTLFHFHAGGISELYERLPRWQQWLFRQAYFNADAAIRLSELNPEDGERMAANRNYVIPYGIDDPIPGLLDAALPTSRTKDEQLKLLFVGVLSRAKGMQVLVDACGKLAARGVPFELELVGQWESKEFAAEVTARIEELSLGKQIRCLGMLTGDDKFAAYGRANVFCFPTSMRSEALPVVLLEAAACGLPVVSTRWRGIPSIVEEGETGYLVEIDDSAAIAERLSRLADDGALRARMGRLAREKFEREYTFARHASRMRRALLETAGLPVDPEADESGDGNPVFGRTVESGLCDGRVLEVAAV